MFIAFMYKFFSKNTTLHIYSNLHVYWFCNFCTPSTFIPTSIIIREMRVCRSTSSTRLVKKISTEAFFYLQIFFIKHWMILIHTAASTFLLPDFVDIGNRIETEDNSLVVVPSAYFWTFCRLFTTSKHYMCNGCSKILQLELFWLYYKLINKKMFSKCKQLNEIKNVPSEIISNPLYISSNF